MVASGYASTPPCRNIKKHLCESKTHLCKPVCHFHPHIRKEFYIRFLTLKILIMKKKKLNPDASIKKLKLNKIVISKLEAKCIKGGGRSKFCNGGSAAPGACAGGS